MRKPGTKPQPICRILIIEDDLERRAKLESWMPEGVRPVVAMSAGRAIGILRQDRGRVYAGILLDHDLERSMATEADRYLCGGDVVDAIIEFVSNDVPVLVHSMNVQQAPVLVERLERARFPVVRIPMSNLTQQQLAAWVTDARSLWQELQDE